MKLNKRGSAIFVGGVALPMVVGYIWMFQAAVIGRGLVQTYQNGVLKKNGQVIACKFKNEGNDYCDKKFGYVSKVREDVVRNYGLVGHN